VCQGRHFTLTIMYLRIYFYTDWSNFPFHSHQGYIIKLSGYIVDVRQSHGPTLPTLFSLFLKYRSRIPFLPRHLLFFFLGVRCSPLLLPRPGIEKQFIRTARSQFLKREVICCSENDFVNDQLLIFAVPRLNIVEFEISY
jgi:hypothetical protein